MAIKISNQITFTEHKKIIEIKEWYLATPNNKGVTRETKGWTTDIQTIDYTNKYLWNYEEVVYSLGSPDFSDPVIIGTYGTSGASLQVKYINSETTPTIINNNVDEWSDIMPPPVDGKRVYMIQKLSTDTNWSTPIQISASDGHTPKIEIIDNYWCINGELTNVKAEGANGQTPEITIGQNGNWFVDDNDTGTKAQGKAGEDGKDGKDGSEIEYVYYISETEVELSAPSYDNNILTNGWKNSPSGITDVNKYEYMSMRKKPLGGEWGEFSIPVIWSKWGERGQDGDGVEYKYYLSDSNIPPEQYSISDENWTDDPMGVTKNKPYEYVVQIKTSDSKVASISKPSLWAKYSDDGVSLQVLYISSKTMPSIIDNDTTDWQTNIPPVTEGYNVYMIQKMSNSEKWSDPVQISADKIDTKIVDGYWYINGETTGVKAEGENGKTPEITITEDGYWCINGNPTNTKALGEAGKDGSDIEYVYYLSKDIIEELSPPSYVDNVLSPTYWKPSPQGITEEYKCEYVSIREKPSNGDWGDFSKPVLWSRWGEKGQDGDGVEYKYHLRNDINVPDYAVGSSDWADDPQGVSEDNQYEYVVQLKTSGEATIISKPSLWSRYGKDGIGISEIVNYYYITKEAELPEDWKLLEWSKTVLQIDPENRYLWNYEDIIYTDKTYESTDPAIIGVYGDSGADAVSFQIYSVDGFEFDEALPSIELKIAAFQNGASIETEATYQWKWWCVESDQEIQAQNEEGVNGQYKDIDGATRPSLIVNKTDEYAFSSIKCVMNYNGIDYEDYVSLSEKTMLYAATIKFFDGTNVFDKLQPYIIAYVELYKNNQIEETIKTNKYYNGISVVDDSGAIITGAEGKFSNGDLMYFVCEKEGSEYDVVLGKYNNGSWSICTDYTSNYSYVNNIYESMSCNVIAISQEDVAKSKEFNVEVYSKDSTTLIGRSYATIVDTNDPIISNTMPTNVQYGQLWLDTSVDPYVLRVYTEKEDYNLEEIIDLTILYADGNEGGGSTTETTIYYGDDIVISEDGDVSFVNKTGILFTYNSYINAESLFGHYCMVSDAVYYIPENAELYQQSSSLNGGYWEVGIREANKVVVNLPLGGEWVYFTQQNGKTVYTSIPLDGYNAGDLWIISDEDYMLCKESYINLYTNYGTGTMLKATKSSRTFNEFHWVDADEETTKLKGNIKQYFQFTTDQGMKIGQSNNQFYVNIRSDRMSFYDNSDGNDKEVVYISNESANIDGLTVETSLDVNCNATFDGQVQFGNFVWKVEPNGSLSLAVAT